MADYPSSIPTFATLVDLADSVLASHQNERGDEITAIATELDRVKDVFVSGSAVLSSAFSITGAAGTYQDTGLSVTLPAAGDYLVICDIRAQLQGNAGTEWFLMGKLYNSTDAADVTNSERMLVRVKTTAYMEMSVSITMVITVTASKVIKLYAARSGAGTPSWTLSQIASDGNGRSLMKYSKIDSV